MAIKNFSQSLRYTQNQLKRRDLSPTWVQDFWLDHVPEGQAIKAANSYGSVSSHAEDLDLLISTMVVDVQRFVWGDKGDEAAGVPQQPAKESEVDGKLGGMTITRMNTYEEFASNTIPDLLIDQIPEMTTGDFFVLNGERIPVPGVEIVSLDEPGGLDLVAGAKEKWGKRKGYSHWPGDPLKHIKANHSVYARLLGFLHWDAGWSAGGSYKVLVRRGLGSTVGVDRPRKSDGKVIAYQWLDPGKHYGWHGSSANKRSLVSFDLTNAVYLKYHAKYTDLCGIERPKLFITGREKIGSGKGFLGMYRDQILTTLRILKAVGERTGQPLVFPTREDGRALGRNYKRLFRDDYHGVATHRHLPSTTKWDIRGFEAQVSALLLSEPALMAEFPSLVECFRLHDDWRGPWLDKVKAAWEWKELWG